MIPTAILNVTLLVVASLWAAVSLATIIGRARHDRRMRRSATLHDQLLHDGGAVSGHEPLRNAVRQLTPEQFHQLALTGLPAQIEVTVAREVRARLGAEHLRRIAEGADPSDVWDRISALHLLVAGRGAGIYRALDVCLRSRNPVLAGTATRLLIGVDDRPAAELLVSALTDGACSRSRLAAALDRMSVDWSDLLGPLLRHPEAEVRAWGARLASTRSGTAWAFDIRRLTSDGDPVVRRVAVEALGRLGASPDGSILRQCFRDPVPMVRAHAARAAAAFGDPLVADALAQLLSDREWMVRTAARDALRQLGPTGRPALLRALWHEDRFAANNAAEALHVTGVILELARRLLHTPAPGAEERALLVRFWSVAGTHLRRGLLGQLTLHEAALLLERMGRRELALGA